MYAHSVSSVSMEAKRLDDTVVSWFISRFLLGSGGEGDNTCEADIERKNAVKGIRDFARAINTYTREGGIPQAAGTHAMHITGDKTCSWRHCARYCTSRPTALRGYGHLVEYATLLNASTINIVRVQYAPGGVPATFISTAIVFSWHAGIIIE